MRVAFDSDWCPRSCHTTAVTATPLLPIFHSPDGGAALWPSHVAHIGRAVRSGKGPPCTRIGGRSSPAAGEVFVHLPRRTSPCHAVPSPFHNVQCVGHCECLPDRDIPNEYFSVHFSCINGEFVLTVVRTNGRHVHNSVSPAISTLATRPRRPR